MKSYVVRFANDQLKTIENAVKAGTQDAVKAWSEISRITAFCERGLITDFEAVALIVDVIRQGN